MGPLFELTRGRAFALAAVASCAFFAPIASANYASDFEALAGSAGGTVLTGQDGWFNPVAGSADYRVYTYAGNALAFPANATGGAQFIGGTSGGGTAFGRAQHNEAFPNPLNGIYTFQYDLCGGFGGTPPAVNNLGSFSIQPSSTNAPNGQLNHLFSWVTGQEGVRYNAFYTVYDFNGVADLAPGRQPGAQWGNLELRHWYRCTTVVDFTINQVIEVRIKDLVTNVETTFFPPGDWYLYGGAAGPGQIPTGFRCFAGGGLGNHVGFDNMNVQAGQSTPVLAGTWGGIKNAFLTEGGRRAATPAPTSSSPVWPNID
jgi:hypothetical protein